MAVKQMAYIGKGADKLKCCILKQNFAEQLFNSTDYCLPVIVGSYGFMEEYYLTEVGDNLVQYYSMFPQNPVGGVDSIQKDLCTLENGDKLAFRLRSYNLAYTGVYLYRGFHSYIYYSSSNKYVELFKYEPQTVEWVKTGLGTFGGKTYLGLIYDDDIRKAKIFTVALSGSRNEDGATPEFSVTITDVTYHTDPTTVYDLFVSSSIKQVVDPWSGAGISDIGGGNGTFNFSSDAITLPELPPIDVISTGFLQLFKGTIAEIRELAEYMWTDNFLDNIVKVTQNPLDIIMSLYMYPFNIPATNRKRIKSGNVVTPVSMNIPDAQTVNIDCGAIDVKPFYGAYLDYEPYTKCEIFLPYCGIQTVSLDDIMGRSVNVKYRVDLLTGACVAFLIVDGSVLYSFSGMCAINIPITSRNFENTLNAYFGIATAGISALSTPAITPALVGDASSIATNIMQSKPHIARSGSIAGNAGFMGIQKPYFIFTVPKVALPKNLYQFTGYPSYTTAKLSDLMGYTEISEIRLTGIDRATSGEIESIVSALKEGVIL